MRDQKETKAIKAVIRWGNGFDGSILLQKDIKLELHDISTIEAMDTKAVDIRDL